MMMQKRVKGPPSGVAQFASALKAMASKPATMHSVLTICLSHLSAHAASLEVTVYEAEAASVLSLPPFLNRILHPHPH